MTQPPPDSPPPPDEWGWTRTQRVGLASLLFLLLAFLAVQLIRRPIRFDDPVIIIHGQPITLPTRIDPNTATAPELARIPRLGEALAAKIIAYREVRKPLTPDNIVFRAPEDLAHIPGLGPKTLAQLRPYLQFPDDVDTQPDEAPGGSPGP